MCCPATSLRGRFGALPPSAGAARGPVPFARDALGATRGFAGRCGRAGSVASTVKEPALCREGIVLGDAAALVPRAAPVAFASRVGSQSTPPLTRRPGIA